eukprot:10370717-Alexandrium_andersonii.AAC.1
MTRPERHVQERVGPGGTSLRPAYSRIQPGRGRGQADGASKPLVEGTVHVSGRAAAEAVRILSAELSALASAEVG